MILDDEDRLRCIPAKWEDGHDEALGLELVSAKPTSRPAALEGPAREPDRDARRCCFRELLSLQRKPMELPDGLQHGGHEGAILFEGRDAAGAGYDAPMHGRLAFIGWLAACALPPGAAGAAEDMLLIDDRRSGGAASTLGPAWRFFTDGVMGGVSTGGMSAETVQGRSALCLHGQVRLENNGGFIQMALELPALPEAQAWRGVELQVLGNGHRYGLHLRTADMTMPWQAWRAGFEAGASWQTLRLPFTAFEGYRTGGTLRPADVRRIGLVAIGERFDAELCLARLAMYR